MDTVIGFLVTAQWLHVPKHLNIAREIIDLGEEVEYFPPERLSVRTTGQGVEFVLKDGGALRPDLVYHRVRRNPGWQLLHLFEEAGVRVVNPTRAWLICTDKTLQATVFARHGIPHPVTLYSPRGTACFPASAGEWVAKPVHGSLGIGIHPFTGTGEPAAVPPGYMVQAMIDHIGEPRQHIRCNVFGGKAKRAGTLSAPRGRWITNQAQGGVWELFEGIPPDVAELAEAAARAVGADCTGVDMMRDREGKLWVLECNEMPQFAEVSARLLAEYLVAEATAIRRDRERARPV